MKDVDKHEMIHLIIVLGKPLVALVILGFVYLFVFEKFDITIPCMFYKLTGYKCPGCGMTHAMGAIWNGDLLAAWEYNPLSLTVLPIMCIYLLYRLVRENLGKGEGFYIWEYIFLVFFLGIVILFGYIRNKY